MAIIAYLAFLALMAVVVNVNKLEEYGGFEISFEDIVRQFTVSRIVDLDREIIFNSFSDIENYPNVLSANVLAVKIINQTVNPFGGKTTFADVDVQEAGVKVKLTIKHTTKPYSKIIIQVFGGDSHGTTITQTYNETDSGTEITNDVLVRVKGLLTAFGFLPNYNFQHAMNAVLNDFIDYTKNQQ